MLEEMGDKLVIKCERNEPCHPLQKQMPQCPFKYYYYLYYRELCVNIIFLLLNNNEPCHSLQKQMSQCPLLGHNTL